MIADKKNDEQRNYRMTGKDWLLVFVLLAVYIPLSLFNLGSREVPETFWKPMQSGDSFIIDFGQDYDISRIAFYPGIGNGEYYLDFYTEEWRPTGEIVLSQETVYFWHFPDADNTGRYARLIALRPGGMLNELAFFSEDSLEPLPIVAVFDEKIAPESQGSPKDLFDEQATIPERPSFMTGMYFDEIYFARTAFEHLNRLVPFDTAQPPLAKILIGLGILLFGMNPFGWRIVAAVIGMGMIPVVYLFGKRLFGKTEYAFLAAFFLTFDFMHFAHTRFATLEGFMVFFIILMYFFMYEFISRDFYTSNLRSLITPLFFSGLFYGMASASKLNGIFAGIGLAVIFFWALWKNERVYNAARKEQKEITEGDQTAETTRRERIVSRYPVNRNRILSWCVVFFILVPLGVYFLSYIPVMLIPDHGFADVIRYQTHMYRYHRFLQATHPFASPWYEWPIMARPIWMYQGKELADGLISSIVSFGNPAVWWGGFLTFFYVLWCTVKGKDRQMTFVLLALASQFIPWMLVPRLTFIYHYFASVPFLIFGLVFTLGKIEERWRGGRSLVILFGALTVGLFALFYPILSGMIVERSYVATYLRWLPSWFFY
ncbi:MAG TPA: phospholipid carrier-dependent glycosyltransferase [Atribacteraceae bacterium]|nr:phospholipid carrier-dependent glycosyltransferase [Atribacteraceae bacterium]